MAGYMMIIPAQAQNRGVYPLGMTASNSGLMPESTFTYSNPVILDMNTITWVSQEKILGARYAASATLPFSKNDLTSDINGNLSGGSGFADSYYLPIILEWCSTRAAVRAMYGFLTPTGRFSRARTTMRTRHFQLQGGLAGYEQRQTTAKTGPGISLTTSQDRYAINALGFAVLAVLPKRTSVGLKYFKEFANRATFQGSSVTNSRAISPRTPVAACSEYDFRNRIERCVAGSPPTPLP